MLFFKEYIDAGVNLKMNPYKLYLQGYPNPHDYTIYDKVRNIIERNEKINLKCRPELGSSLHLFICELIHLSPTLYASYFRLK